MISLNYVKTFSRVILGIGFACTLLVGGVGTSENRQPVDHRQSVVFSPLETAKGPGAYRHGTDKQELRLEETAAAVAEPFASLAQLLARRQGIDLGNPISSDQSGSGLSHFQLFTPAGTSIVNSAEQWANGCIYVAYTPPTGQVSYDAFSANDRCGDDGCERNNQIAAGATDLFRPDRTFGDLKKLNTLISNWKLPAEAFRFGRGPAPRWFKMCVRPGTASDAWTNLEISQIPAATPTNVLLDAGRFCFGDTLRPGTRIGGPPEWQTILPGFFKSDNGQRKFYGDRPIDAVGNHYVDWPEIVELVQQTPGFVSDILRWRNHPADELSDHRIPWKHSRISGVVTNSFLSGEDYAGDHRPAEANVYLGDHPIRRDWARDENRYPGDHDCGTLSGISNALCDDWIVYLKPDPEYRFTLATSPNWRSYAKCLTREQLVQCQAALCRFVARLQLWSSLSYRRGPRESERGAQWRPGERD